MSGEAIGVDLRAALSIGEQVGPGVGWQTCRHTGTGRMSEPEDICRAICEALID